MKSTAFKRAITTIAVIAMLFGAALIYKAQNTQQVKAGGTPKVVRIGYFANLTHAPALIAHQKHLFEKQLPGVKVEYTTFTVGTAEIEAIKGGALDLGYVGPGPAISGYVTTQGSLLNIVSGATTNGAMLVVKPKLIASAGHPTAKEISSLVGKNIADPGLGGTQDVALRTFLKDLGLWKSGAPTANIIPLANADTLAMFQQGKLDGAWVPEPWATRLIQEGGARLFLDEKTLWPDQKFATTLLVAAQKFSTQYPQVVSAVVKANQQAIDFLNQQKNKTAAIAIVQEELLKSTGKSLPAPVIETAWGNLEFDSNPAIYSIKHGYGNAVALNQLPTGGLENIRGIFKLESLNSVRKSSGLSPIVTPSNLK